MLSELLIFTHFRDLAALQLEYTSSASYRTYNRHESNRNARIDELGETASQKCLGMIISVIKKVMMQGHKSFLTYDVICNFDPILIWCKRTDRGGSMSLGALLCFALNLGGAAPGILERFVSYVVDDRDAGTTLKLGGELLGQVVSPNLPHPPKKKKIAAHNS